MNRARRAATPSLWNGYQRNHLRLFERYWGWSVLSIAPDLSVAQQRFRVTHPFHPWFGREFALVTYRLNWGEERVYFHDDTGRLAAIPARWTSVFPADPFVAISTGRSPFRFAQLRELARLIQQIGATAAAENRKGRARDVKGITPHT